MAETLSLFRNKKFYKQYSYPLVGTKGGSFPKPMDFWYEKTLYGRVDERQNPIYISMVDTARFKQIHPSKPIFILNFVADAFFSFQRHFRKAISTGRLNKNSALVDLEAEKGFVDMRSSYGDYRQTVSDVMVDSFLSLPQHNDDIENFDDFLAKFVEFVKKYSNLMPFTQSGYIKSQYCTPLVSGLVIEIGNEDHTDDTVKERWLSDPNYEFYAKESRKFGFIVDKNAPWRLVANIMSPRMQNFMRKIDWEALLREFSIIQPNKDYGSKALFTGQLSVGGDYTESPRSLFNHYYTRSYKTDVPEIKQLLLETYEKFYDKYPTLKKIKTKMCSDLNKISRKTIARPEPQDVATLLNTSSNLQWTQTCFEIRLIEEKRNINDRAFERIMTTFKTLSAQEEKNKVDKGFPLWYLNQAVKGFPKLVFPVTAIELMPTFANPIIFKPFTPISIPEMAPKEV